MRNIALLFYSFCYDNGNVPFYSLLIFRVLTVHGSMDKIVPVEDAFEFSKSIANHDLCIMEGADHEYTSHQDELASVVVNFVRANLHRHKDTSKQQFCRKPDKDGHSRL